MVNEDEWLQYDVNFATAGFYSVTFRTASNSTNPKFAHLEVDGLDVTGKVTFPDMGGWQVRQQKHTSAEGLRTSSLQSKTFPASDSEGPKGQKLHQSSHFQCVYYSRGLWQLAPFFVGAPAKVLLRAAAVAAAVKLLAG